MKANEWGCEGLEKLGIARGVLSSVHDELEELQLALDHIKTQDSLIYIDDTLTELIDKLDKAFNETGMQQSCTPEKKV